MDLFAYRIVPVVSLDDARDAEPLAQALMQGGLPIAEVTFRTTAAAESIAVMSRLRGFTVGAGTVVEQAQLDAALTAGARFVVSPGLRAHLVRAAQAAGVPVLPGAVTPSELMAAQDLGLDTVKFFPAAIYGGPAGIRALAGPFPTLRFVPTGGVEPGNLTDYLRLSCVPAVGGSWVAPKAIIAAKRYARITELAAEAVALASQV
ncbi:MAG: bifunctional 4-hydroxy-2-oxoglutarate aldolase/2-dehydro-3-deoxy-phosphogluconate aldolase [Propionibacteriaceae bacterium]|jgi:2-dehydro-3-deoxyphosphogluconate aldolase/(4S)-4-hydroxy-2-oxoglutarate aldolase|nr:bifunctional 4-hydroxy-2-oxoglutarate aldolase/2-dehydro-3-deoxy-phosphogluconate aldolase [Propionibacteriaceae bacterium]